MKFEKVIEKYEDTIDEIEDALNDYDKFSSFEKSYNEKEAKSIKEEVDIIKGKRYMKITNDSTAVKRIHALTQRVRALYVLLITDNAVSNNNGNNALYKKALKWERVMTQSSIQSSLEWVESEEAYAIIINKKDRTEERGMYTIKPKDTVIRPGETWTPVPKRVFRKPAGI